MFYNLLDKVCAYGCVLDSAQALADAKDQRAQLDALLSSNDANVASINGKAQQQYVQDHWEEIYDAQMRRDDRYKFIFI